jgi:16S rRNA (guanine1207-N2)-methyltransferase
VAGRETSVMTIRTGGSGGGTALPVTQLLLRNLDRLGSSNLLLLGAPEDDALVAALGGRHGAVVVFDYRAFRWYESRQSGTMSLRPHFTPSYAPDRAKHDVAIVFLQKGSELNDLVAAMAHDALTPGGTAFFVGENKAGIRSAADVFARRMGPIVFSDRARHCALYQARRDPSSPDHATALLAWEREYTLDVVPSPLRIVTVPGVFGLGRLDAGTRLLLEHLPRGMTGSVLDFGCGSGVIGAAVKARVPDCAVTLADASAFALYAARRTFEANSLSAERIVASDVFSHVDGPFDLIISNPPFHQGIATNYEIVSSFFAGCASRLKPGGRVIIVANKFLPYERQMAEALTSPVVVAQNDKFKVLSATVGSSARATRITGPRRVPAS